MLRTSVLVVAVVAACGDNSQTPADAARADAHAIDSVMVDAGNPLTPSHLFGTGLCVDHACGQIAAGIVAYTPRFPLWADTASKHRWMYLPPGTKIDTSDMDHWVFPQGTKFWKEFTRDNVRVETRYLVKTGPGNTIDDWFMVAYQWNATEDDAIAVPDGVQNANGTPHDIPSHGQCQQCHENLKPSRVLGFQAIQLDAPAAVAGEMDLDHLIAASLVTTSPPGAASPHFPLPGNTTIEQPALGYLHANCGHCHNPTSTVFSAGVTMVLRLDVGSLGSLATTPPYRTAIGATAVYSIPNLTTIVVPHDPAHSILIYRFETTNVVFHMPALGSEMTDPAGDSILTAWIQNLP
jgi:hypothetical protein